MMEKLIKYYRIGKLADVSEQTISNYIIDGKLGHVLTPSGQRIVTQDQLDDYLDQNPDCYAARFHSKPNIVFYVRSSMCKL